MAEDRTSHPEVVTRLDQPFTETGLYSLRAAVSAHADAAGVPQVTADALLLVAGELTSNVVRHGGGTGRLALWRDGDDVICQVTDHGPGIADPDQVGRTAVPPTAVGGRGIWIVRQLTHRLDIATGPHGTTVTAVISVRPALPKVPEPTVND